MVLKIKKQSPLEDINVIITIGLVIASAIILMYTIGGEFREETTMYYMISFAFLSFSIHIMNQLKIIQLLKTNKKEEVQK